MSHFFVLNVPNHTIIELRFMDPLCSIFSFELRNWIKNGPDTDTHGHGHGHGRTDTHDFLEPPLHNKPFGQLVWVSENPKELFFRGASRPKFTLWTDNSQFCRALRARNLIFIPWIPIFPGAWQGGTFAPFCYNPAYVLKNPKNFGRANAPKKCSKFSAAFGGQFFRF